MDEIDAALDFKNVSIVAHYIKERTKNAQFIIISLRNNIFKCTLRVIFKQCFLNHVDKFVPVHALLQPTMKIKRTAIENVYESKLDGWYESTSKIKVIWE